MNLLRNMMTVCLSLLSTHILLAQAAYPVVTPDNASSTGYISPVPAGSSSRDVVTITAGLNSHITMSKAIQSCGMASRLRENVSLTVFAPNNAAFAKLPPGFMEQLMKPENAAILSKIISYHVIEGQHTIASIKDAIRANRGRAEYKTLSGNILVATIEENRIKLIDDGNTASFIITGDVKGSNGIVHAVDKVVLPR